MDMPRHLLHLILRQALALPGILVAGLGCGPESGEIEATESETDVAGPSPGATSTSTTGATTQLTSSSTTTADDTTDGSSASSGGQLDWSDEMLLTLLDGDALLPEAQFVATTANNIHVGARSGTASSMRWTVDRQSGSVVSSSPVGGPVLSTEAYVYTSGYLNGSLLDERAVARINHDGTGEEVLMTSDDTLFVVAATAGEAFFFRYGPVAGGAELWRISDASGVPTLLADLGEQASIPVEAAGDRLLMQDGEVSSILEIDLDTGAPLLFAELASYSTQLAAQGNLLYVGTSDGLHTATLQNAEVEDVLEVGPVLAVAATAEDVFWLIDKTEDEQPRLFTLSIFEQQAQEILIDQESKVDAGYGRVIAIDATSDEVLLLRTATNHVFNHVGSLWRLPRPD